MHWIDRGTEPDGLGTIRDRYTPRWVAHYRQGVGNRPTDSRWREFHSDLCRAFSELCAYCEETTGGAVDHFMPKSKFPELVYEWSNWVLACPECNQSKGDRWPDDGYVDPCASDYLERPETFFDFNTRTGRLRPKDNLPSRQRQKAWQTINDIGLNADHHLKARMNWLAAISESLSNEVREDYLVFLASRSTMLSSITRALLDELGFEIND